MHSALAHVTSVLSKRRPIHLTYFVTRRCNAHCRFCFYERARAAPAAAPELSLAEVREVARSLERLLWVVFSGGEPFLRADLVELAGVFHDVNRAPFLTFPTNGLLPDAVAGATEAVLARCPGSVVVVKLSLDGLGADHDALRRVPGAFDAVLATHARLAALARRHPRLELGVNTVFCAANQDRMDGIVDLVRGLEAVSSHTLAFVRPGAEDRSVQDVDVRLYARALRRLDARWGGGSRHAFAGAGLKAAQDRVQRRVLLRTIADRRRVTACYAGRLAVVLGETGELLPCEGLHGLSFGNVRDVGHDVRRLLGSERAARIREEISRGGCHCTNECNLVTNILFNPAHHPALLRELAWRRLREARAAALA